MGYSTTIYAVDLNVLRSSIDSGNLELIDRLRKCEAPPASGNDVDPTKGPRIRLALNSDIFLNGNRVSWEEFTVAILDPKWHGTNLYTFQEPGQRTGQWSELGSFKKAMRQAIAGSQFIGELVCDSEEELLSGWHEDEGISAETAAEELILGTISFPDAGYQYGYGLERICRCIGTLLGSISGKNRMKSLKLSTLLEKIRCPVSLPKYDDFPYISHLSHSEVELEIDRIRAMDLSYPKSKLIEEGRRSLLRFLEYAGREQLGVVAFYY